MATGIKLPASYARAQQKFRDSCPPFSPEAILGRTLSTEEIVDGASRLIDSLCSPPCQEMMKAQDSPLDVFRPTVGMINRWRRISSFGEGVSWPAFDTTLYHYPHPDLSPKYPGVHEMTEAVVIAFSGSGLTSASGRNFMQLANVTARRGVALVSLDYPFHREGPRDEKYMDADVFHQMAMKIVEFYKSSGLPTFLMGHSQGPLPIQELLFMNRNLVSAAIMFSPGGAVSRELVEHYRRQDAAGAYDSILSEKIQVDDDAEAWEMAMDKQAKTKDLRIMSTEIPVWIIAGDEDPWSSPDMIRALAAKYPNGMAEIVSGVGHHIFHARLPNGKALMPTRIFEIIEGVLGRQLPKLPKMSTPSKVLYCYRNSEMFRGWLKAVEDRSIEAFVNNPKAAKDILERWNFWLTCALFEIFHPTPPRPPLPERSSPLSLKIWSTHTLIDMAACAAERETRRSRWTPNRVNRALKTFGEITDNHG